MTKKIILLTMLRPTKPEGAITEEMLKSKEAYTCANHAGMKAYCMCAKCGSFICERCNCSIGGRQYCENCVRQDYALLEQCEQEFFKPKKETAEDEVTLQAPQSIKEIPRAIWWMCCDSEKFFKVAKSSPFGLTFTLSLIAFLVPNILQILRMDSLSGRLSEVDQALLARVEALPTEMLIAGTVVSTVFQVLLLDLLLFACIRGIAHTKISFGEVGSLFHYSSFPIIFVGIGIAYDLPLVSFLSLCLVIISLTTAVRAGTKCSFWHGVLIMLVFIFLSNILRLLSMYAG